jgi:hypothetical protein
MLDSIRSKGDTSGRQYFVHIADLHNRSALHHNLEFFLSGVAVQRVLLPGLEAIEAGE